MMFTLILIIGIGASIRGLFWLHENDEICIIIEVASEGKVLICSIWFLFSPCANNYCGEEIPHCFQRINWA